MQLAASVLRPAVRIEPVNEQQDRSESSSSDDTEEEGDARPSGGVDDLTHLDSPELYEAVLFSSNGREHAFFSPKGDPVSFRDALKRDDAEEWTEAALAELLAHLRNGTRTVVELPPGKAAIGSRWVFKLKLNPDGTVDCYKTCASPRASNTARGT